MRPISVVFVELAARASTGIAAGRGSVCHGALEGHDL
jgi:hypothetical protein